jgi:hypothetical protein
MSKIKTYYVFVNCVGFRRYKVEATNKADAERKAEQDFVCDCQDAEAVSSETRLYDPDDSNEEWTTGEVTAEQYPS